MIEVSFIILYGLSFLGGLLLTFVWGRVAWRGKCWRHPFRMDQFCLISVGLTLGAFGNAIIFGTRTVTTLQHGVEPAVLGQTGVFAILFGLGLLAVSKAVLLWAHDPSHQSQSWRWYALLSLAWCAAAPVWVLS